MCLLRVNDSHLSPTPILDPYSGPSGSFVLVFNDDHANCTNASTPNKYYYVEIGQNGVTELALKNYLASALTAAAAGKQVDVLFDSSTPACYIKRFAVKF